MNHISDGSLGREAVQAAPRRKLFFDRDLQIIFAVTLMAIMGVSNITPAFPMIVRQLGISFQDVGLLITAFTLPGVLLTPVMGVLADRWGRKRVLIPSLMLFGVAGGACGFTQDFATVLVLRFIQGAGGAALGVLNVTLIGDLYTGRERASAMGYNASVLSIGTATYPAIGGVMAVIAWNAPFLLSFLAIPVGLLVLFSLKTVSLRNEQRLSEYLAGVWTALQDRRVIGLFIVSIATFILLYGSYQTYLPLLLGNQFASSSVIIGLLLSSMSITTALTASQLGMLVGIFSEETLVKISFVIYAAALAIVPFITHLSLFLVVTVLFGVAHGMNIPSLYSLLATYAPARHRAAFMSVNGMILRGGQTLGPLVIGLAFTAWGMNGAFLAGAALGLVVALMAIVLIR